MYTQVLFAIFVTLPLLANSRATHCERWKGDSEFRCGKDNYHADSIHIRNIGSNNISFKIGKWLSQCGRNGVNYFTQRYNLGPGGSMNEAFGEVSSGSCHELFVYECNRDGGRVNCLDIVSVYPN